MKKKIVEVIFLGYLYIYMGIYFPLAPSSIVNSHVQVKPR